MTLKNETSTKAEVCLRNISKSYWMGVEEVCALKDVSLDFQSGEFWAILGASGSGKSTMLNLLGCLDRPTSGDYILSGNPVHDMDDDQLSDVRLTLIGFIFQSFNLIPQLTVEENIQLPLYYLGWDPERSTEHARKLASDVGLETRLRHKPVELSGGQQQRVAVARALANNPQIILADEPTGNLDSKTGQDIMNLLCRLNEQGKTIIMVTHENEIASFASKKLFMKDGYIERIEG